MDKQQEVIENLIKKAENIYYGVIVVEFKIHQGKINGGEVIKQTEKLG